MRSSTVLAVGVVLGWAILFPRVSSGQTATAKTTARFMKGDFAEVLNVPKYRSEEVELVAPK